MDFGAGMNRWQIGDVRITRFVEMETLSKGTFVLPDATLENIQRAGEWLRPHFADENGRVRMSIHAYLVESAGKRIIVDTCIGNDKQRSFPGWSMLQTSFLADLEKGGFPRDSIDLVLCTHLHVDHVGWNTMLVDGHWAPTFTSARYLIGRKEWAHWSVQEDKFVRDPIEDSVRPIVDAGLADLIEDTHQITNEMWLEPTPRHTPGHFSVRISSRGEQAVITGDLMHHPVQCEHPAWNCGFDADHGLARKTRGEFLQRYVDQPILVFGTHFATPSAGYIIKHGATWRFRV
jgi:glyoxylase-like metal-dependent hydrolase (beta-lactamase superfamily II)